MTSRAACPRVLVRVVGLVALGAAVLAGCGLPPGGDPPGALQADVISTDPHVAAPLPGDRVGIDIEIEVTRIDGSSVGSMSIEDVDGAPLNWSLSTGSSCFDTPNDKHCTADIGLSGPETTTAGDYEIEIELRVDGVTIDVTVTLSVPI